jgi:ABC-type Fe3+-hydroxamate transport system substrate-binding protein
MISYLQAVDVIRTFAINHLQIQRFGFEFREQMPNLATISEGFPYLFVVPVGSASLQNVREIDFDVYCVDRYQKGRANVPYVISDTDLILADLSLWLEEGQNDIEVVRSYPTTPINNDLLDYVGGHVMRLRVQVDRIALCEIPFDGDAPVPPSCPSGFVRNSDNTFTEIVPSGSTITLPDITVTDSDGSTYTQPAVTDVVCTLAPPCEDAVVNVNSVFFDNVASGGTLNIEVRKSSGSDLVGSKQGQYWRIADSTAVLKTSGGATISTTSIKAEESEDITAPDATVENSNASYTDSVVSGGTLVLPDITVTDSDGSTYTQPSVEDVVCTLSPQDLTLYAPYATADDTISFTIITGSDGTITSADTTGLTSVTYDIDGSPATLPFTLAVGDVLTIDFDAAGAGGVVILTGTYA